MAVSHTLVEEEKIRIQVLDRIYHYSDFEKRRAAPYTSKNYNLNNIKKLLDTLGNPQEHFRTFHIAGTKGKGTTTYLMAYLLEAMGFRTGHTVSPQLIDERDRFYLRGRRSHWKEILPVMEEILHVVEKMEMTPTVFDIFTAIAFQLFRRFEVEIAIIETGLGGRWDSTNCLDPPSLIATLITLIDYDHMDKLGSTLSLIAGEKAGIIKPGIPLFTLNTNKEVIEVLQSQAEKKGAPFYKIKNPMGSMGLESQEKCHTLLKKMGKLPNYIPKTTWANFNLAIECLLQLGYPISEVVIRKVINRLPIPGRYQKIDNLLIDGAHTVYSLQSLVETILSDPELKLFNTFKIFFFCLYNKDVSNLVRTIPADWELFFFDCQLHYIDPKQVYEVKKKIDRIRGQEVKKVKTLAEIPFHKFPHTLHIFTGSFKLVGKVLSELSNINVH